MDTRTTTAAPAILTLADGIEYRMSPLTDEDMDELTTWCQSRVINIAERSLPPDASKERREEMLTLAIREASRITWMTGEGARMMATIDGLAELMVISIRKNHPGVSREAIKSQLKKPGNIAKFNALWRTANNVPAKPKATEKKSTRRKSSAERRKDFIGSLRNGTAGRPK